MYGQAKRIHVYMHYPHSGLAGRPNIHVFIKFAPCRKLQYWAGMTAHTLTYALDILYILHMLLVHTVCTSNITNHNLQHAIAQHVGVMM